MVYGRRVAAVTDFNLAQSLGKFISEGVVGNNGIIKRVKVTL